MSTAVPLKEGARLAAPTVVPAPGWAPARDRAARPVARTRWWLELFTIVWLAWVYDAITNLAPLRLHVALGHARDILSVEQTLGIDPEHALDRWLAGRHALGLAISDYYDNAHFIVTLGLLGFLWWRRADIYRGLRSTLVLVNVLGFVVFWLYPVAPPRMLPGFTDVVSATHAIGSWHTGSLASHANELAAMPSLHMAWAGWCGIVIWRISARRWARALALAYPVATCFAVLATGNHFVLDVLGGFAVLGLAVVLVAGGQRGSAALRARRGRAPKAPAAGAPVETP
ncbi:MAG TPA: phosphatase PAP2 family protein [Solirubrobacteraceae bacterium]|nr:phosphatase PAP2 family protein [Solirubrobacteraceae bacterium]